MPTDIEDAYTNIPERSVDIKRKKIDFGSIKVTSNITNESKLTQEIKEGLIKALDELN